MIENPKNKVNFKKVLRIVRHSSIPLAVVASCGLITLFGADRWILRNLEEQRDLNFRQVVSRISLQLSENVLLSSYNNIDTLLLRILDEDLHITCLAVAGNNGKFLSIASREKPGSKASIKYGLPPENCRDNSDNRSIQTASNGNFYASSKIKNNNLILGSISGHAVNDENDLALIRSIELILFGAFGVAFLPAFGVLSWSSNRQLELEQEKTGRVSALIGQLKEAQGRTRAAFEGTNDGWLEWNVQTDECIPSQKFRQLVGFHANPKKTKKRTFKLEKVWKRWVIKEDQEKLKLFLDNFKQVNYNTKSIKVSGIELRIIPIDSKKILTLKIEAVVTESIDNQSSVVAIVANNVTHDKEQQERINHLAFYDTLTGLRNRFSFSEELKNAENGLNRNEYRLAIFAIDVDNFKFLNDSHGHASGDQFLIQAANRIQSCTRQNDFVARLGGDEFVIIYRLPFRSNSETEALAKKIAGKLLIELSKGYNLKNCTTHNTCSIGICIDSIDLKSTATLLDKADIALYKAKEIGRNCFFIYQKGMASEVISKATTAEDLKRSIKAGESSVYLQPIVRLENSQKFKSNNQKIVGYEALFRCKNLNKSVQYLISCAEEAGMINLITESILDGIEAEFKKHSYNKNTYISINISPVQFLEFDFPKKLLHQLRERQIDAQRIYIEITETAVLDNTAGALERMNLLQMEGIHFSLDDFGTGYASIELLRKLPFTSIKIDRSYIQNVHQDSGIKLVKSIISMAKAFNMTLIGEGVETIEQKNTLNALGCEYAQGFLFDQNGNNRKT